MKKKSAKKPTRGERVITFIERYCRVPEGDLIGRPMHLLPFEREFILAVYDNPHGTKRGILSMGRKNGKTSIIACIVLAHLVGPEARQNSQLASGAQSRDNAALVFDLACKIIALNPDLGEIIKIGTSKKYLIGLPMNVEYKALSADGKRNMGGSPSLAILDEVGQVVGPKDPFIDAVITSQGAHKDALLLVISTQAASDSDLLSLWIDDALTKSDVHTICHLHAAPESADLQDESAWLAANPALGIFRSIEDMQKMALDATRMPSFESAFRNLYLNQRISVNSPFISRSTWAACSAQPMPIEECDEIYAGLDLSAKTDLTALILLGLHTGTRTWHAHCYFWTPEKGLQERAKRDRAPYDVWVKQGYMMTTPGATVALQWVANKLGEICSPLNIVAMAFDRWRMDILKKELEEIGLELPLKDYGQGFKDMAPAVDALEGMILNATLRHGGNPVLTMCAANAVSTSDPAGNRKLDKLKTTGRIDGFVALAMAAGIAERMNEREGRLDDFISAPLVL